MTKRIEVAVGLLVGAQDRMLRGGDLRDIQADLETAERVIAVVAQDVAD